VGGWGKGNVGNVGNKGHCELHTFMSSSRLTMRTAAFSSGLMPKNWTTLAFSSRDVSIITNISLPRYFFAVSALMEKQHLYVNFYSSRAAPSP
jgi:hypothetical protein